ncbi:MAG: 2-hydroxyacyl-CoA dehydratase subunit D [Planctomycetota bacterium]|jgi:benzoyl-CoA reductase/2-hydroxyglutaryl-CoA dehydratase subunit BcrC/BadD/HgdB
MNDNNENGLLSSLNKRLEEEPRRIAEARKSGKKVVGYFCPYGIEELILAADMLPVRLAFGGELEPVSAGEDFLKPYSCPYTRSCLGYKKLSTNFYYSAVDAVCVAYTYNSMRRIQEYWEKYFNLPAFPLGLPQTHDSYRTKPQAIEYFKSELELLRKRLGEFRGKEIKDKEIRKAIALCNHIREKLLAIYEYTMDGRTPIEWRQILQITQAGFLMDRGDFLKELEKIEDDLRRERSDDIPYDARSRLMISGSIIGTGDDKVLDIIRQAGGNIVADSVCTASMFLHKNVATSNPMDALAERYLYNVPCPFMTDLPKRLNRIVKIARDYRVHGLIYYNLKYCDTWRAEFKPIKDTLYRELSVPTLLIETDYSPSDADAIKAEVEAFIKKIGGRR